MLGDLLVVGERPELGQAQLDGVLHEPVDLQAIVGEARVEQCPVFRGLGERAVAPEVPEDALLVALAGLRIDMLEQPLHRTDQGEPEALHQPRMTQGDRGRGDPRHRDDQGPESDRDEPQLVEPLAGANPDARRDTVRRRQRPCPRIGVNGVLRLVRRSR